MPTFFVTADAVTPPTIRITDPLLRHLRDSLRLKIGDPLTVTDSEGTRYLASIATISAKALEARIINTSSAPARIAQPLVLALALLKGEKMDWVIQKATELGVERFIPVQSGHSVVKVQAERVDHQRARWERIALEAAQQSERWTVPTIDAPTELGSIWESAAGTSAIRLMLAERSTGSSLNSLSLPCDPSHTLWLLVGPEGGWDVDELRLAHKHGWQFVSLGTRILRAETAAIAAVSILQSRLGELG